jgi:hypothetical protein
MFVYLLKRQVNDFVYHVHEIKHGDIHFICSIPFKAGAGLSHQYIMDEMIKLGKMPAKYKGMKWDSPEVQRIHGFKSI